MIIQVTQLAKLLSVAHTGLGCCLFVSIIFYLEFIKFSITLHDSLLKTLASSLIHYMFIIPYPKALGPAVFWIFLDFTTEACSVNIQVHFFSNKSICETQKYTASKRTAICLYAHLSSNLVYCMILKILSQTLFHNIHHVQIT